MTELHELYLFLHVRVKKQDPPTHLKKCIALCLASIASGHEANWPQKKRTQAFTHPEGQEGQDALTAVCQSA